MIRTLYESMMMVAIFLLAAYWWEQEMGFFAPGKGLLKQQLVSAEDELEISRTKLEEAGLVRRMR